MAAIAAPLLAGVGSALAQRALSGGSPTVHQFAPPILRGTGFNTTGKEGDLGAQKVNIIDLTRSQGVKDALTGFQNTLQGQSKSLKDLLPLVEPGFGRLTEAGVTSLRNRAKQAIGNLRQNLARRRVAGSSFAEDTVSRLESEFAQQESQFRAQSFLQELDTKTKLINQSSEAMAKSFEAGISQFNFESSVLTQLSTGVTSAIQSNAQIQSNLALANAQGMGNFFQPYAEQFGRAVSDRIFK